MKKTPWTQAEVDSLNNRQKSQLFHPYTCPGDHKECAGNRNLIATEDGWVCRCGKYKQDWYHA